MKTSNVTITYESGDWNLFQAVNGAWADKTFGKRPATGPLNHALKEIQEAIDSPKDIIEYADVMILMIDAARIQGWTVDDIFDACVKKQRINMKRKWGEVGAKGFAEHDRSGEWVPVDPDSLVPIRERK